MMKPFSILNIVTKNKSFLFEIQKNKWRLFYHPRNKLWKHMLKIFSLVEAAGGLVEHQSGKVLFIFETINGTCKGELRKRKF